MSEFMKTFPLLDVVHHAHDLKSLYFPKLPEPVSPGQFYMLWLPGVEEKPFSVSDVLEDRVEITVRGIGPFTNKVLECQPGTYFGLRGPFGNGFQLCDNMLVVGGGCGVAPVRYLAKQLEAQGLRYTLAVGTRSADDLLFADEYEAAGVAIATEDGSLGHQGLVTDLVRPMLESGSYSCLAASGPEPMLLALRQLALEHKVPVQLSFERYMKCGVGVCGQCCMDGSGIRLCVEGPVLDEAQMAGISELGRPHRDATGQRHTESRVCKA
jgi:dihydroorotate dehydrogenase electron transfer subunit